MRFMLSLLPILFLGPPQATAAEHDSWKAFTSANRRVCQGPFDTLKKAQSLQLGGKKYSHHGYQLRVEKGDADSKVVIGLVSAIKDVSGGTKNNFRQAAAWFKQKKVEWVVANGDLALDEFDLEDVFGLLGETGLPTLLTIGNSESRASWSRAYLAAQKEYPNLINGNWVRQVVADDVEFWTLPGYFDKVFLRPGSGCSYDDKSIESMEKNFKASGKAPVVFVSHGPPRGKGKRALDYILDGKNVGDPRLNRFIKKNKIAFGLFGHILEAGGNAVGADMNKGIPQKKKVSALYVNAGALSGDPWPLNDGRTSWGMAMVVTIENNRTSYELKRFAQFEDPDDD